jgi:TRAP-type C4-dicarboxylate transport system permease small subunit
MRLVRFLLVDVVEFVLVCLLVALCADLFLGVFSRYVVGQTFAWYDEVARYLFIWLCFVAAAVAVRRRAHFGVNVLVNRFAPPARRGARLVCWAIVVAYGVFITVQGLHVIEGVSVQESPALGISLGWVFLSVPVHGVLCALYAAQHLWDAARGAEEGGAAHA